MKKAPDTLSGTRGRQFPVGNENIRSRGAAAITNRRNRRAGRAPRPVARDSSQCDRRPLHHL